MDNRFLMVLPFNKDTEGNQEKLFLLIFHIYYFVLGGYHDISILHFLHTYNVNKTISFISLKQNIHLLYSYSVEIITYIIIKYILL